MTADIVPTIVPLPEQRTAVPEPPRIRLRGATERVPRWVRRWGQVLAGVVILGILVVRLGSGPFVDGLRTVDGSALVAAVVLGLVTTLCCAWRWSLVARGLGTVVPFRTAVAAYYRSQLINTSLPGGVLGDVHRGIAHGRETGHVGRGLRVVAWERSAGQAVQLGIAVVVLLLLPSPVRSWVLWFAVAAVLVVVGLLLAGRWSPLRRSGGPNRLIRTLTTDLRAGVLSRRSWPGVVLASALVVVCQLATFVVAARTAGSGASFVVLLPIALLVLLAMAIPANVAGWGPREGVAAWAFAAAGLTAATGVATAVVYGVMVLVASLPGAGVLVVAWWQKDKRGRVRG